MFEVRVRYEKPRTARFMLAQHFKFKHSVLDCAYERKTMTLTVR